MELPSDFITLMRQQYGDATAEMLFKGLAEEPCVSVRLNPNKVKTLHQPLQLGRETSECQLSAYLKDPVPWCPDAYYLKERPAFTFDPHFHAGVYYVQEASSMYLAEILKKYLVKVEVKNPELITSNPLSIDKEDESGVALDLCAAPGGKSTLLRSLLPESWLLVSNEPIAKRTQILAENMIKWGYPNTFVTQNYPQEFSAFNDTFDLIVTDVPCSGEGMFRKDEGAIHDWSLDNVDLCWHRQRDILKAIWSCLKDGGLLVYSTCTFNHYEDEDNVRWIASELGAELLEERHFLPGRDRGEGFYIAALKKIPGLSCSPQHIIEPSTKEKQKAREKLRRKISHGLRCFYDGSAIPKQKDTPTSAKKGAFTIGRKVDLVPPHALAMSTEYQRDTYPEFELNYEEALTYLRHEVLRIKAPKGIILVTFQNIPLGFVKNIGERANNLYPQEWRIRTTYTTPFLLLGVSDE